MKQCRNCRGSTSSSRSRVSDGTRPTPYSVSRQNRLVRMHGIVELQKILHAEHRQAQAICSAPGSSMRQARTSFNRPLSVLRMPGIFAVHPALRVVSRRDFPHQKANSPESSRKVYEIFFQTLYFSKGSSLSGNCWTFLEKLRPDERAVDFFHAHLNEVSDRREKLEVPRRPARRHRRQGRAISVTRRRQNRRSRFSNANSGFSASTDAAYASLKANGCALRRRPPTRSWSISA